MRVLTPYELSMMTKAELDTVLCRILQDLPHLAEGSAERRAAHANLQAIRSALADPRPGGPAPRL